MRVLGCWSAPYGVCSQLFSSIEIESSDPAQFHRIIRPGAAVLIRKGTPGLSYAEAFDGFAVVDGDIFEPHPSDGSSSAASLVLNLFRRDGAKALERLEGNAFIAVWDARAARLILARDRFGMGMGYWMEQGRSLLWSSELTTLLRCDPRVELDTAAVDQFLADGRVTAPWTSLQHIRKLPSAHLLEAHGTGVSTRRYWRQDGRASLKVAREERLTLLEEALLAAHRRQSSAKPAAALLSGGVDSMLMVALLAKLGCAAETFTYRYTQYDGVFNEGPAAARAAAWLGLRHYEMEVGPQDIADRFEEILWQHQGPLTYGLHTAILSAIADVPGKVLFSGQGNGGPSWCEQVGLALSRTPGLRGPLARLGRLPFTRGPLGDLAYIGRVAETRLSWRFHSPLTSPQLRGALYARPELLDEAAAVKQRLFAAVIDEFSDQTAENAFCASIQRLATADSSLQWTTSFARAHGLLGRCPFYDRDLIDLMYRLPREREKRDLREIAAKYLPRDLAFAPKIGQTIPIASWLRGPMADWLGQMLAHGRIVNSGMFRPEVVHHLYTAHLAGRGSHGWTLWSIAALVGWQEMIRREAGRYTSRAIALSAAG